MKLYWKYGTGYTFKCSCENYRLRERPLQARRMPQRYNRVNAVARSLPATASRSSARLVSEASATSSLPLHRPYLQHWACRPVCSKCYVRKEHIYSKMDHSFPILDAGLIIIHFFGAFLS
eukprot:IDg12638t1